MTEEQKRKAKEVQKATKDMILMHPKSLSDVGVSDEALKGSICGFNWFDAEGVKIMAECGKKQISVLAST